MSSTSPGGGLLTNAFVDDTETWRDRRGYDLSQRIWSNRARLEGAIDATLRDGILRGDSADQIANDLLRFVRPSYAATGAGTARHAALRLAANETRRAYNLSQRDVARTDPSSGYLRYTVAAGHIVADECSDLAAHDEGYGLGVYPADDCPLPPRHPGCRCSADPVRDVGSRDIMAYVEQLRVEYDLADPPDLGPEELAVFRRETAGVRAAVQIMFRAWLEQTGLVTTAQLVEASPTVRQWVAGVRAEKARRRG